MRTFLRNLYWFLSQQVGIDARRMLAFPFGLARYAKDWLRFRRIYRGRLSLKPCVHDWWQSAGSINNEYFWQDLFVAQLIFKAKPHRHIDVGSRLDGFVAHLAVFREVEVMDVRPMDARIPGVKFLQADLMSPVGLPSACTDSVSCLHALEHFGLGRYGDPICPDGHVKGLNQLAALLKADGLLYLAFPTGADATYFNAHRTLSPATVCQLAANTGLSFVQGWLFHNGYHAFEPLVMREKMDTPGPEYTLGLHVFQKTKLDGAIAA